MIEQEHIDNVGLKAKDKVTGFKGVITSISFDLYGCVQYAIVAACDGKVNSGHWFDPTRLVIKSNSRVMPVPDFSKGYIAEGNKGPAEKPAP